MLLLHLLLLIFIPLNHALFFPMTSSCGCSCPTCSPPPICPPQPTCPPVMSCPVQTCCSSCTSCKLRRVKRDVLSNSTFVADIDHTKNRTKRQAEFDPNRCNSEVLKTLIVDNIDRITSIAKQRIQDAAEKSLNGRYNVICARGDFSYVVNTELYCQHTIGDVTCFLFKQLSDVVRRRLA